MECSTTSTRRQRRRGSSLIELLVATAISVIILAASGSLLLYTARSLEGVSNYMGMAKESRLALDRMSQEIRMSDRLVSFSTNHLAFNFEGDSLVYAYDANNRTLTRSYLNLTNDVLTGCEQFLFSVYQRNTVAGTFDQYPVGSTNTAKIIELSWICTREILGAKVNSESVHSSKIVLRNQQ